MADNAGQPSAQPVAKETAVTDVPVVDDVKPSGPLAGDATAGDGVDASEKPAAVAAPTNAVDAPVAGGAATDKPAAAASKALTPIEQLWAVAQADGHPEIWGHTLGDPSTNIGTQVILQKMLNANDGDLDKATAQLKEILRYRAEKKPLDLVKRAYSKTKFDNLGYITVHGQGDATDPEMREIFTWNLYGQVENIDVTFGDTQEFIDWRLALMELAVQELNIGAATKPISAEYDPYKTYQVHDYQGISFFKPPPNVKAASSQIIKLFGAQYPELLKEKFFVNVPFIMGFVYGIMKPFVAAKTLKKFHPMREGKNLANEFADSKVSGLGNMLPKAYGGSTEELKSVGRTTNLE